MAAGDCCEARHRVSGEFAFVPLGTHANKQGRVVGVNVAGGRATFGGILGTAITRFVAAEQHLEIAKTGLSTREAESAGFQVAGLVTKGRTASGYMPEAAAAGGSAPGRQDVTLRDLSGVDLILSHVKRVLREDLGASGPRGCRIQPALGGHCWPRGRV